MQNKFSQKLIPFIIIIVGWAILKYYLDLSNAGIAVMAGTVIVAVIIFRLVTAYVKPPRWLFHARFILLGFGAGIMSGLFRFFDDGIENQSFELSELLKILVISSITFMIFLGGIFYLRFRSLRKKTISPFDQHLVLDDFATLQRNDGEKVRGRLLLTDNNLYFFSAKDATCLFEAGLKKTNPVLSKFLKVPSGINFPENQMSIWVAFPYLWLDKIEYQKGNS
ncbi:MAG: hypothetical protein K9H64_00735 [Bacteroidales bacterium]|nr:hypothetical protein [Bacteroidales bacterium]MCF8457569.1 hypothetical protein [Bacteroidales bacterium]